MRTRTIVGGLSSAIGVAALMTAVSAAGQAPTARTATGRTFVAPKTAWGDPDISGTWTSDDLRGVPMSRPDQYGTRAELSDEEFAKREADNAKTREQELNRVGAFRNDVGTRTVRQTSLVVDPPDGKVPAMTPDAQRRGAQVTRIRNAAPRDWFDRSFYDRCITRGVMGSVLPVIYGNGNEILQSPGYVTITYEMVHDTRVIPLDGRPHLGRGIQQYLGDARGHWDGSTLVVETTNFKGGTTGVGPNGGAAATSDALRIVERFTRTAPDILMYEATIDDPKTYTRPFTIRMPLGTEPGYRILPYECHEGNFALKDILSAARAEDRAIEDAIRKGEPPPKPTVWQGFFQPEVPATEATPIGR